MQILSTGRLSGQCGSFQQSSVATPVYHEGIPPGAAHPKNLVGGYGFPTRFPVIKLEDGLVNSFDEYMRPHRYYAPESLTDESRRPGPDADWPCAVGRRQS